MATYLETHDGNNFTDWQITFVAETAQALGLRRIDDRNYMDGKRYVGIRRGAIQVQGFENNNEATLLLAISAHAIRFTTDRLVGVGDTKRRPLTELLPLF